MAEYLFPWLSDVDRAAQYLASLSLSTAAQAAMLIRAERLWAYAGELSQPAIEELLKAVLRKNPAAGEKDIAQGLDIAQGKDFAQFVALESSGSEYLLYSTRLDEGMLLALAFDIEVPFSKIRLQANRLANALKAPPGTVSLDQDDLQQDEDRSQLGLQPLFPLEELPPPTPALASRPRNGEEGYTNWQHETESDPSRSEDDLPGSMKVGGFGAREQETSWGFHYPSAVPSGRDLSSNFTALEEGPLPEERQPLDGETNLGLPKYKAVQPQLDIGYTFLLVPRMPAHRLLGELAIALEEDMRQLSMAFGWRLERMVIQTETLQWGARVTPSTSPSRLVRLIRKHTSQRLFARFPQLERDNPSGDFWAPGYLVMSSTRPLPAQVVKSFVQQTRLNQGASA